MIRISKTSPDIFSGWLRRYIDIYSRTRFPVSYQALCGIWALSTVVGRKAVIEQPGFRMFPPQNIMLFGDSGVGKSMSLEKAYDLVDQIIIQEERPEFFLSDSVEITEAGLHHGWAKMQSDLGIGFIEGAMMSDEIKGILTKRTGTENMQLYLMKCAAQKNVDLTTKTDGKVIVRNVTVGFAFCSSIQFLRQTISADDFGGGFMHRFLCAHETQKQRMHAATEPTDQEKASLAEDARAIWANAPTEMAISKAVMNRVRAIESVAEDRPLVNKHLKGFWQRFAGFSLKIAGILALSDSIDSGDFEITTEHLDTAEQWIRRSLYPPLEELVVEMGKSDAEKRVMDVGDDLFAAGIEGIPMSLMLRMLPGATRKAKQEALGLLTEMGMARIEDGGRRVVHPRGSILDAEVTA